MNLRRCFEIASNIPGDCFCFTWTISCFLTTVEHMDGVRKWRSICTIGMSILLFAIILLLWLSLCPVYYWSDIKQIIHYNYSYTSNIDQNYSSVSYLSAKLLYFYSYFLSEKHMQTYPIVYVTIELCKTQQPNN